MGRVEIYWVPGPGWYRRQGFKNLSRKKKSGAEFFQRKMGGGRFSEKKGGKDCFLQYFGQIENWQFKNTFPKNFDHI